MMNNEKKVVIWGDSVTKGVIYDETRQRYALAPQTAVSMAAEALGFALINHSRMGATVLEGEKIMQRDLDRGLTADMAIIGYGGNDCDFDWAAISRAPEEEHLPKTPAPLFEKKLKSMIGAAAERGIEPVLVTLPPIVSERYFSFISRDGLNPANILQWLGDKDHIYRYHERYSALIAGIARECGCRLLDLRTDFLSLWNPAALFCPDGIHPNQDGQRFMGNSMIRAMA